MMDEDGRLTDPYRCGMRDTCGSKSMFGKQLPCPYDGPPKEPDSRTRKLLTEVCGPELASGPLCCTHDQLSTLQDNFKVVDRIVSACPACKNNFHDFFCKFTCAPDQGAFLNVTSTQKTSTDQIAVKSVDFFVGERFGSGFFDSCKNVKFDASNGFAMDFIGGGATNYQEFFHFLGEEKDLGSPFQINFPSSSSSEFTALNPPPRNCSDNDLSSRCTCIDCPDICPVLPDLPSESTCHVGLLSCLSFVLILAYSIAVVGFLLGFIIQTTIRQRRQRRYERLALAAETASPRALVGAGSLAQYSDDDSMGDTRDLARSLIDPVETVQPRQYKLNTLLRRFFYSLGLKTASSPWLTFAIVFLLIGLLNIGWTKFEVETDPVRLWVPPNSETRVQKEFFDQSFGPFYRPQQIFITSPSSPVLSYDHLKYWFSVESTIRSLSSIPNNYTLPDVCFSPAGPGTPCVVQSVGAWFGNSLEGYDEESWSDRLVSCANSPVNCLPDFGQPLAPHYVLGGVPSSSEGTKQYLEAEALVVTYVVSDSLDPEIKSRAEEWERSLRAYLVDLAERAPEEAGLELGFSTGVSLEEEINKSSNTDVRIVVLSYVAMFFYVALSLGSSHTTRGDQETLGQWIRSLPKVFSRRSSLHLPLSLANALTASHTLLALFALGLVVLSVSSSVALFSACGVKVTLIIAEVIPFLVLAVGVDNVFILVGELERQNGMHGPNAGLGADAEEHGNGSGSGGGNHSMSPTHSHPRGTPFTHSYSHSTNSYSYARDIDGASMPLYLTAEERVARTLAKMGPSILLSTLTEGVAFALGALVPMPAVRNFALYAAGGVAVNALLQVTVLIAALTLDLRRLEANRIDCFPCIQLPSRIALPEDDDDDNHVGGRGGTVFANGGVGTVGGAGRIARFIRRYYAPFLLKPAVKAVIIIIFSGIFVASVIMMQFIQLGLDQRLALPSDSYLVTYFNKMDAYLDVGPPVYFVSRSLNATSREGQQALCGRFTTCAQLSLSNTLEAERSRPAQSYIADPAASWIDNFLAWLDPEADTCCRVRKRDPTKFCGERDNPRLCKSCFEGREPAWNITMEGLPEGDEFMWYLRQWLKSPTSEECPLGGKASFGGALALSDDEPNNITDEGGEVLASHFRTFHSPLKTQDDFISSLAAARRIAEDISTQTGTDVFPYSLHYVFFDQYAHIISITQEVLGIGLLSVLLVTAILLGSWRTGSIVTGVVGLTVVSVMGVMAIWGISLNAISLVNLVISLGIAVEFCAHVARAFMNAGSSVGIGLGLAVDHPAGQKERDERMWTALADVGPSVLSGITFTKLIGMCVLALTRSKLLEIYYFRMWLTLIISGALHGLVLLPVVLSIAGGPGFPMQEADEEWMANAIRNDYEYAPFLADDDSVASD